MPSSDKKKARQRERKREWRKENPLLVKERNKIQYMKNVSKRLAAERNNAYGISGQEYLGKFIRQDGVCALCHCQETAQRDGLVLNLAVDHDHLTDKIRDLLCSQCNLGLGCFVDNPSLLRAAAEYLEKHEEKKNAR